MDMARCYELWPARSPVNRWRHSRDGGAAAGHVGLLSGIDAQGNPIMISERTATGCRSDVSRAGSPLRRTDELRILSPRHAKVPIPSTQDIAPKGKVGTASGLCRHTMGGLSIAIGSPGRHRAEAVTSA